MIRHSSIPGLQSLALAVAKILDEDAALAHPKYLSLCARDLCVAGALSSDARFESSIDCATRYWAGQASDEERERHRVKLIADAVDIEKRGAGDSMEWYKHALVAWSLENHGESNAFAADYLYEFALQIGIPFIEIKAAMELNIPGLSASLEKGGGLK